MIHDGPAIHPQAHVDLSTCSFGDGTFVWQGASVIRGARVGQCCTIGAGATVDGSTVGDESLIGSGAQLHPGTRVGKKVFVGPGVIFCNDRWPSASKEGFHLPGIDGPATVIVEDGASIGAGVIVLPGVVIGKDAMIAAGCVVERPIPDGHILYRDGSMKPIRKGDSVINRMRWANEAVRLAG